MVLIEPVAVPDVFVSGLSHIEQLEGGNLRFVCYISTPMPNGEREYAIAAKIVIPVESVPDAIQKAMEAAAGNVAGKVARFLPKWMH